MGKTPERVKAWQEKNKKTCKCGKKIYYRSKTCKECYGKNEVSKDLKLMTLGEYKKRTSAKGKHPSWINAELRNFARSWNKELRNSPCQNCGYDKHAELCHIQPISSFSESITLGEINSKNNLLVLCRNCHWEFDNKLLTMPT